MESSVSLPWFFNGGNTQTRKSIGMVNYDVTSSIGMTKFFDFSDRVNNEPRQFTVAPKGYAIATERIPIWEFQGTKAQTLRLYTWGWLTYHDVFDGTPTRLSEFCQELVGVDSTNPDMTDPASQIKWTLALCPTHNCNDEECTDYKEKTKGK